MINNKKKNNKKIVVGLFILFICLLSLTIYTSFSSNIDEQEIVIKSMTPTYDETSTIEVDNNNVVFNDKNQVVKYNVVLENTQDYDVKISDIKLSTPTEEFLDYKVEGINKDDVLGASSTKELTISFETMGIKGWGRNFADELTANISFEKVVKQEEIPPVEDKEDEVEHPKEEVKVPEKPAASTEELISKTEKIEIIKVTKDTIEFKETPKLEKGDKIAVWLYSDPVFLGHFDVIETNGIKQIVGLEEALKQANVKEGEHHIVLATEDNEAIGYVEVYVSENKNLSSEAVKEESPKEEIEDDGKVENPYTSDKGLLVILVAATTITGIAIIVVSKNKFAKYTIIVIMLSSTLTLVNAEDISELPIKLNVSFKSQNVMKPSGFEWDSYEDELLSEDYGVDYWEYARQIKNFYIQNEITEIDEYEYEFDVTEEENGRVVAYLVERQGDYTCSDFDWNEEVICYDLYLQADGVIYPNEDASYYFAAMDYLDKIYNMSGIDTSEVISMRGMFNGTGEHNETFTIDLSNFDTSNVTDMSRMFTYVGNSNPNFTLDISSFDTSNVTNMSRMFYATGENVKHFKLNLGDNFDTSNVTDMSGMFTSAGFNSEIFTLDLGDKFDTSNVTDMSGMFSSVGYSSTEFTIDLGDNFDTSNVTNMASMFNGTGYSSTEFTLDLGDKFDTSSVIDMSYMFNGTGYSSTKLNTSITISNPNVASYSYMFNNVATKEGSQIKVNFTKENELLVIKMLTTVSEDSNVIVGVCTDCGEGYVLIGTEISIGEEKFNVISQTDDTVTMLAQYNLGTDYRQTASYNPVKFSDTHGWEYTPGPKEIDIQIWSTNPKTYVNAYVEYLKTELEDDSVTGDLITLTELKDLGCTIPSAYEYVSSSSSRTCTNSPYKSWLINNQGWWSRSANSTFAICAWDVGNYGTLSHVNYNRSNGGVRPVITISKSSI